MNNATLKHGPLAAKKTVAIVQLSRFGDLVQGLAAVKKAYDPENRARFVLIARKQFADPLRFLLTEHFDEIYTLDTANILDSSTHKESLLKLNSFLRSTEQLGIDVLINQTFSKASSFLCSLINATHKMGPRMGPQGAPYIGDSWSQYLYSSVMSGPYNGLSLVDIFSSTISKKSMPPIKARRPKPITKIALHPFASHGKKKWRSGKWSEVIRGLLKDKTTLREIVILGSKEERIDSQKILDSLADEIGLSTIALRNLTGVLGLEESYNEISTSQLFLGHDSLLGHLAAHAGVQSITIALGTVRPIETTPYQENALVLSPRTNCYPCFPDQACSYYACHNDLTSQHALSVVRSMIRAEGEINESLNIFKDLPAGLQQSADVHFSYYNKNQQLSLHKLTKTSTTKTQLWQGMYNAIWPLILTEQEPLVVKNMSPGKAVLGELPERLTALRLLFDLCEFGKKYSTYIIEEMTTQTTDINKIKLLSKKIEEIDRSIISIAIKYEELAPVIRFYELQRSVLSGENLLQLTQNAFLSYNEMSLFVSGLHELAEGLGNSSKEDMRKRQRQSEA